MARDVPGSAGNYLTYGSDASVDNYITLSMSLYVVRDTQTLYHPLLGKQGFANGWTLSVETSAAGSQLNLDYNRATTRGVWSGTAALGTGTAIHVVCTYDNTSTTNDPVFYVNGALDATTELSTPVGAAAADAANSLVSGQDLSFNLDRLDGRIQHVVYDNTIWDAAAVNRARWWGRPHGGVQVYHPFITDKLGNEGSATANASVTGTVNMAAMVTPVVRPGSSMMGMGMGW